jgi:hypothetical protein
MTCTFGPNHVTKFRRAAERRDNDRLQTGETCVARRQPVSAGKRSREYKRVSKRRGTPRMDAAVLAEALDSGRHRHEPGH